MTDHECKGREMTMVKNIALKKYESAASAAFDFPPFRQAIIKEHNRRIKRELAAYSKDPTSVFKYRDDVKKLADYRNAHLMEEAEKKLPLTYELVTSTSKNKCKFVLAKQALVLSSILNSWISKSLFVYRNNVLLMSAGCKGEEIECFQKLGLCSHKNTIRNLHTAMGKGFDKPVAEWKAGLENNRRQTVLEKNIPHTVSTYDTNDIVSSRKQILTGYRCVNIYLSCLLCVV